MPQNFWGSWPISVRDSTAFLFTEKKTLDNDDMIGVKETILLSGPLQL